MSKANDLINQARTRSQSQVFSGLNQRLAVGTLNSAIEEYNNLLEVPLADLSRWQDRRTIVNTKNRIQEISNQTNRIFTALENAKDYIDPQNYQSLKQTFEKSESNLNQYSKTFEQVKGLHTQSTSDEDFRANIQLGQYANQYNGLNYQEYKALRDDLNKEIQLGNRSGKPTVYQQKQLNYLDSMMANTMTKEDAKSEMQPIKKNITRLESEIESYNGSEEAKILGLIEKNLSTLGYRFNDLTYDNVDQYAAVLSVNNEKAKEYYRSYLLSYLKNQDNEKLLAEEEAKYKSLEEFNKYTYVVNEPDFEKNSKFDSKVENDFYQAINKGDYSNIDDKYSYMNQDEKSVYNYLFKQNKSTADQYIESIDNSLIQRSNEEDTEFYKQVGEENPFVSSIMSVGMNIFISPIEFIAEAIATPFGYEDDGKGLSTSEQVSAIREGAASHIDSEFGQDLYMTFMSGMDSLAASGISLALGIPDTSKLVAAIPAATLSASAAASTAADLKRRGASQWQAIAGGFAAGAFEYVFEKYSIGKFFESGKNITKIISNGFSKKMVRELIKEFSVSAGVNFSEEYFTELANVVYDSVINGDVSNYNLMVKEFMRNGDNRATAEQKAQKELSNQIFKSGLGGLYMGVMFSGFNVMSSTYKYSTFSNQAGNSIIQKDRVNTLLSLAEKYDVSTNLTKENSKNASANKIGRLYIAVTEKMSDSALKKVENSISNRLDTLGFGGDTDAFTKILTKLYTGNPISSKEMRNVKNNRTVLQVYNEIVNTETGNSPSTWYVNTLNEIQEERKSVSVLQTKNPLKTPTIEELLDDTDKTNKIKAETERLIPQLSEMGLDDNQSRHTAEIIAKYKSGSELNKAENVYINGNANRKAAFNQIVGTNSITGYVQPQEQETPTFKNVPVNKDADSKFEEPNLNSQNGVSFTDAIANEMNGVPINEPAAMKVQDVASKLGLSIVWDIKGDPEKVGYGYIKGNVIHLNPKINNPIFTVFKHEFVHYLENTGKYQAFADYVKTTDVFKNWIRKVGKNKNYSDALQAYRDGIEKIYKGSGKELSYAEIDKEMIANFVGENLFGGKDAKSSEALLKALANEKWYDVIKRWFQRVIAKVGRKSPEAREILKLEDMFTKMYQESKKEGYRHDGVRYYPANSDNTSSIKEQIKAHLDEINKMDPVSNISYTKGTKKELKELAIAEFKKKGYKIDRKGFGIIEIGEKQINDSLNYLNTLGDYAALLAVPDVLKRGKMFSGHDNHKNRSYSSVTFAAPVTINGITGDMAAVVRQTGKNRYYTHRILMPDGSEFVFQNKNEAELTSVDMPVQSAGQGTTIGSASNNKIAQKPPVVNTNIRKNKKNNTSQNYIPVDLEKISYDNLRKMVQDGEMTKDELWESFNQKSGSFDKGAKPRRDIDVPQKVSEKTNVRRAVRTILEDKDVPDEYVAIIKDKVLDDKLSYTVATNEQAEKYATKMLEQGEAQKIWSEVVSGGRKVTKNNIAVGEMLLKSAVDAKDAKEMLRYAAEVSEVGTRLGQAVQAFSLLKKMGGIGELLYIQKAVDTMNRDLEKKYKNNAPQIQIDENLAGRLASAKNTEDSDFAKEEIMRNIGEQVPSTFLDKWNAWRYMSMLLNFRTHLRNFKGNAIFLPFVKIKNAFAYAIERVLPDSIINESQYTKSLTIDKKYKDFAREDFENDDVQNALTGGGKMNPAKELEKYKRIFKSNALEKARKFNFDALEKEDSIFLKMHYIRSLGEVLQARKIDLDNITQEQLFSAREYAIQEAKKATYRDTSDFANLLNRLSNSNKAANIIVEGLLPFKKTPINVVKRGMEYSPVGLIKTLSKGMYDLKKGKINISEFCDGLASGLTGTGIMAVGMLLQALGVISVGFGGDDEDWFKQLNGEQEYSIQIFGKSYTIDWAAPACIPFFIGAELQKALNEDNENFVSAFTNCMTSAFEPIINLSMLQGINDTLNSIKYSDDPFGDTLIDLIQSYFMQAIPTLGGQISRTIDGTRRANYIDKNSPVPEVVQSLWNAITSKVPGLSYTKQPYVDEWGREEKDGNIITRLFLNMISPGYYSDITYDATNREIQRVYDQTGENKVFPSKPDKYIKVDGETKYLTAEEYTELSKKQGEYANNILSQAIEKDAYKNMSDLDKADFISKVYSYSKAKSKYDVLGYEIPDNSEMAKYVAFDEAGADMGDAFIGGLVQSSEQADTNNDRTITKDEKIEAIRNSDIKDDFTKELWEYFLQRQSNRNGKPMDEFVGDLAKRIKQ